LVNKKKEFKMTKTFKYTTNNKNTYGVYDLDLKEGDLFKLIDTKLSCIEKTSDALSVYQYQYTICIPKHSRCFILDDDEWWELIAHSEFVFEKGVKK